MAAVLIHIQCSNALCLKFGVAKAARFFLNAEIFKM